MATTATPLGQMPDPSDYKAFEAWRDSGGDINAGDGGSDESLEEGEFVAPATGEEDQSLSDAEAELAAAGGAGEESGAEGEGGEATDETGEESETAQQAQQQEKPNKLEKRMRKLTNRIAEQQREIEALKAQATPGEESEEAAEDGSGEQPQAATAAEPVAPMLGDFDTLEEWKTAYDEYVKTLISNAKIEAKREKDAEVARARNEAHMAEWNTNAARFSDFNEVVTDNVQISHAMSAVMHLDTEAGTRLAYYLGQHPDESLAIAKATLAPSEAHWGPAKERAALMLGKILAKIEATPGAGVPQKKTPTPAAKTTTAKTVTGTAPAVPTVSKANRPPAALRGQVVRPGPQSSMDVDPSDYKKWEAARERELAAKQGRK